MRSTRGVAEAFLVDWKHRFLRMLVDGDIVSSGEPLDKDLVGRLLDRIEGDAELQAEHEGMSDVEYHRTILRLLEETRSA
jgi:hypothetical protein